MDGLSAAASIIAVIQISEDVALLCSKYLKAVKNAKKLIPDKYGVSETSGLKATVKATSNTYDFPLSD